MVRRFASRTEHLRTVQLRSAHLTLRPVLPVRTHGSLTDPVYTTREDDPPTIGKTLLLTSDNCCGPRDLARRLTADRPGSSCRAPQIGRFLIPGWHAACHCPGRRRLPQAGPSAGLGRHAARQPTSAPAPTPQHGSEQYMPTSAAWSGRRVGSRAPCFETSRSRSPARRSSNPACSFPAPGSRTGFSSGVHRLPAGHCL